MWPGWETVDIFPIKVLNGVVIVRIVFSSLHVDAASETSRLAPQGHLGDGALYLRHAKAKNDLKLPKLSRETTRRKVRQICHPL